jgi:hypothetical protein
MSDISPCFQTNETQARGNSSCYKRYGKEEVMEEVIKEKEGTTIKEEKNGKRKWGGRIYNFMAYGGFMLVIIAIVVIIIIISLLTK